jgi:hypothetical protein
LPGALASQVSSVFRTTRWVETSCARRIFVQLLLDAKDALDGPLERLGEELLCRGDPLLEERFPD